MAGVSVAAVLADAEKHAPAARHEADRSAITMPTSPPLLPQVHPKPVHATTGAGRTAHRRDTDSADKRRKRSGKHATRGPDRRSAPATSAPTSSGSTVHLASLQQAPDIHRPRFDAGHSDADASDDNNPAAHDRHRRRANERFDQERQRHRAQASGVRSAGRARTWALARWIAPMKGQPR